MPQLRRVGVRLPDSLVPEYDGPLGVSQDGSVAIKLDRRNGPPLFVVVDSSGALIAQARNEGRGPSELGNVNYLGFLDDGVEALDIEQLRAVKYNNRLRPRDMSRLPIGSRLGKLAHDSVDIYIGPANGGPLLVRVPLKGADTFRVVIGPGDSAFANAVSSLRSFEIDGPQLPPGREV